jgi:hypothetical protein
MSVVKIEDEIAVDAPVLEVWKAIKNPSAHAQWHPFLTEISGEHGLNETRTCSVLVGGKRGTTTERCVEEDEPRRMMWLVEEDSIGFARMVANWHAGFSLSPTDRGTVVTATSTLEPKNMLVRAMLPLIRRKFHQTHRTILAALKHSLEETVALDSNPVST